MILALCFFLGFSFILNLGLAMNLFRAHGLRSQGGEPEDEFPQLTEIWSYGDGDVKAVRIPLMGVIERAYPDGRLIRARHDIVEQVLRQIRAATNDEDVQAIVLEVDSPGGEITPTDEIYEALMLFRDSREDRKVISFVSGLGASGGYYVTMASDWIVAEPTAVVGSFGVIMQTLNWKGLSEKVGVTDVTIQSVTNKDLLNPFRDPRPEELGILQGLVDSLHERFFEIIQEGRGIEPEKLRKLADGSVFTVDFALEQGLIDEIGYWEDVMDRVIELLGVEGVRFVRYEERSDLFSWLSQLESPSPLAELKHEAGHPRLLYLWKP